MVKFPYFYHSFLVIILPMNVSIKLTYMRCLSHSYRLAERRDDEMMLCNPAGLTKHYIQSAGRPHKDGSRGLGYSIGAWSQFGGQGCVDGNGNYGIREECKTEAQ